MDYYIGIGDYKISNNPEDVLKTYSLATCIGITAYSPVKKVMAMVHIPLPDSQSMRDENINPCKFVDTAVKFLFNEMYCKYGCKKEDIKAVKVFGGIMPKENDIFRIGEKNLSSVKNALDDIGVCYDSAETGGRNSRTLVAYVDSGKVEVHKSKMLF